jgi:hypothetical protein
MRTTRIVLGLLAAGAVLAVVASAEEAKKEAPPVHKYVGVAKGCMCHGPQKTKWATTKHAGAFAALASDAAKAIAKEKGIADPQKEPKCLKCHVTGYGKPAELFAADFKPTDGVQCEACHGPGSDYKAMPVMKAVRAGTKDPASVGLVMPTAAVCTGCHNSESPTFKSFDFTADSTLIAHPIVKK